MKSDASFLAIRYQNPAAPIFRLPLLVLFVVEVADIRNDVQ